MEFKWRKPDQKSNEQYLNPAATFRIMGVSRIIANDLGVEEGEIWWLVLIDPAVRLDGDGDDTKREPFSIQEIYDLAVEAELSHSLAIPPGYGREFVKEPAPSPFTLFARRDYIQAINTPGNKLGVKWLEVGSAFRKSDLFLPEAPFAAPDKALVKVPQGTVVMAVIDNGMAVGHELFRGKTANGDPVSRVDFYWNMDGADIDPATVQPGWTEPTTIGNGWTAKGLTKRLNAHMHNGLLDDPAFYASIGATDWGTRRHTPVAHRVSHGTHVMGLCAGYPSDDPLAGDVGNTRPLIAVNLRSKDVSDPSGILFAEWLEQALFYILERYSRYVVADGPCKGQPPPMVINFSFGDFAGPHDGTSLIERQITSALEAARLRNPNCQFVLPAGNGNDSQTHARVVLTQCTPRKSLTWQVQPDDKSVSAIETWLDKDATGQTVHLTVQGPGALPAVQLNSGGLIDLALLEDSAGKIIGIAYYLSPLITLYDRGHFAVYLYPTTSTEDVGPFAPAGAWEVTLEAEVKNSDIGMNLWIERDETLPGFFEFGRQSYFVDPTYDRFYAPGVDANPLDARLIGGPLGYDPQNSTALVRREGTISGFAGAQDAIVVGAFVERPVPEDSPMALYSSTGLQLDGDDVFPITSARSDDSAIMRGVLSAGSASGSLVALDGTSVSAPQVARWVADQLAKGDPGGVSAVCQASDAMDPTAPGNDRKPPPNRTGCGRMLDLPRLFGQKR